MNTQTVQATIPRPEHPNPQFRREQWYNLNGTWDFKFDFGVSGIDRDRIRPYHSSAILS